MFISTEAKYIFVDNLFTFGSMSVLDTMSLLVFKYHFDLLSGQPIDSPVNGPAPLPWNIPAQPQQMFSDFQTKLEVPHTANIKVLWCVIPLQTLSNGQFQKISIPNLGRLPCFNPPLPSKIPKCAPPPCPQNSIVVNPPSPSEFPAFLEVHFRLSNAYKNKRTWIYASSRLWSSCARWQALLFSDKKNLR